MKSVIPFRLRSACVIILIITIAVAAPSCSFQKKVRLFRSTLDLGGESVNSKLEKFVTVQPRSLSHVNYDPRDPDAFLDVYIPSDPGSAGREHPTVIWIHGGGWIAGSKEQVSNYSKILAQRGFTVVAVGYSLAPEKNHPTPVRQVIRAIEFLLANADEYQVNKKRLVIAGDSGGAQIAAQAGIVLTDSVYAKNLGILTSVPRSSVSGMILYCGTYDFVKANEDKEGLVLNMMLRAYSGHRKFEKDRYFHLGSVIKHIPQGYPPTFISVGNKDILKEHSYALARELREKSVRVDSLFFEYPDAESLNHEYQFDLESESAKLALERTVQFLEQAGREKRVP